MGSLDDSEIRRADAVIPLVSPVVFLLVGRPVDLLVGPLMGPLEDSPKMV